MYNVNLSIPAEWNVDEKNCSSDSCNQKVSVIERICSKDSTEDEYDPRSPQYIDYRNYYIDTFIILNRVANDQLLSCRTQIRTNQYNAFVSY